MITRILATFGNCILGGHNMAWVLISISQVGPNTLARCPGCVTSMGSQMCHQAEVWQSLCFLQHLPQH